MRYTGSGSREECLQLFWEARAELLVWTYVLAILPIFRCPLSVKLSPSDDASIRAKIEASQPARLLAKGSAPAFHKNLGVIL